MWPKCWPEKPNEPPHFRLAAKAAKNAKIKLYLSITMKNNHGKQGKSLIPHILLNMKACISWRSWRPWRLNLFFGFGWCLGG
jgi:hypothetical protein